MVQHHTLRYHLKDLEKEELYEIAKVLSIKNRSKMDRQELEDSVCESIKYNGLLYILNSLGQKSLELVSIVLDFGGNIDYETLKKKYPDTNRSLNVNLNKCIRKGALFRIYYDSELEEEYIQIPKDLIDIYNNYLYIINKKMSFREFLEYELDRDQLIALSNYFGLPHTGSKEKLSERIESNANPEEVLYSLDMDSLKEICENMGLSKTGKKEELVKRILKNISSMKTKKYKVKKKPFASATTGASISTRKPPFYTELYDVMNKNLNFIIRSKTREKDIEDQLYQFLSARFPNRSPETQVKTSAKGKIDMAFVKENIGIELKYKPNKAKLQRLVQQIEEYHEDFKRIIVLIVTEDNKIGLVNKYKGRIESIKGCKVVIYKT